MLIKAASGGNVFWYGAEGSAGASWGGFGFVGTDDALTRFWVGKTYSSPYLSIEDGGNVGIGTTTPADKLSVNGSTLLGGKVTVEAVTTPAAPASTSEAILFFDETNQSLKVRFNNGNIKTIADNT